MEKKIAGLLGAMATLGAFGAAQAAPTPAPAPSDVLKANSYADLLEPIQNATAVLQAVDEAAPTPSADDANIHLAQIYIERHHHHHHHHHHAYRRRIMVVPPRYRHHHHHHHHHHSFYRRDY
jgi:hypothetical protein